MENTMKPFGIEYFESVNSVDTHGKAQRGGRTYEQTYLYDPATGLFDDGLVPDSQF